jgi:hypothetical protein
LDALGWTGNDIHGVSVKFIDVHHGLHH